MSEFPELEVKDSEDYKIVYTIGAFGGLSPNDGRVILYVDRLQTEPIKGRPGQEKVSKIIRERQVEIHMSPGTWKNIAKWMSDHVTMFEKQFGEIPALPKGARERPPTGLSV